MVEDEGAALGAALQAAWCAARRSGRRDARIEEFTDGFVAPDESTRCRPDAANAACYREMQAIQDELSLALRRLFPKHRKIAAGRAITSPRPA
jgi:xylulokinase